MYLHAGNNRILRSGSVIGIFDLDTASRGEDTKNFLRRSEHAGKVESAAEELPKSFILFADISPRKKTAYQKPSELFSHSRVLFSQISASALKSRCEEEIG